MTNPEIVKVDGCGQIAKTWIANVKFKEIPDQFQMGAFVTLLKDKPYHIGMVELGLQKYYLILHCKGRPIRNSHCKDLLQTVFEKIHFKCQIEQMAAFNGYHLELFGLSTKTTCDSEQTDQEDLEPEEQEELGKLYDTANTKDDLDQIYQDYLKKHHHHALALKTKASETKAQINWVTDTPATLEVVTKRSLREWQKLEWVLLRDRAIYGGESLRTNPRVDHWDQFFKLYYDISPVGEPRQRMEQAFKTFADHVKAVTGKVITRADLQKGGSEKMLRMACAINAIRIFLCWRM